nr:retrovirus-related Pol polyprotein from transposon TNT 1-94 [Tanacetum cinerariifolium]
MRALLIQHGCEAALEVLPKDMEAQAKAELNKKAQSVVTLCLASYEHFVDTLLYGWEALTLEDMMATLNSKKIKERSKTKGDGGEGLYVRRRTYRRDSHQSRGKSRSKFRECDGGSVLLGDNKENKIRSIGKSGKVKVINGSSVVLSETRSVNCVYSLDGQAVAGEFNASVDEKDSLAQVWYKRLRHISEAGLHLLEKQGRHTTQGVIGYVHSYLWGPSHVEALKGKRYFLSIIDDYSRRVWVYILKFKHRAFRKFKEWKQLVENQIGRTVKKLRTDTGLKLCNWEFEQLCMTDTGLKLCNWEFEQLCIESVIARHLTVAGMPHQNGLADHTNRTLMDKVEVELQRLNNHTFKEDQIDQEDGDDEDAGDQETNQTHNLTDYQLTRDREPITRTKPLRFQDESNMAAYAFFATEEEDTHEPLTYQEAVACEDSSKWKVVIKEEMDSPRKNKTWELVDPLAGYKARLMAHGFTQRADDMLIACKSKAEIRSTKSLLKKKFDMKELGEAKKILDNGKSVKMPLGGHFKLSLKDCLIRDCDVERMSKVPIVNAVGSLMYLMVCTRPDIVHAKATLQHVVALSTIEAEYMALTGAMKEAIWLRGLLEELSVELNTVAVNCDNPDAIHLSRNHVFHERTKHNNVRCHFIREVLEVKTVKVLKVSTEHNAADALTKVVPGLKLQYCLELMNVGVG